MTKTRQSVFIRTASQLLGESGEVDVKFGEVKVKFGEVKVKFGEVW